MNNFKFDEPRDFYEYILSDKSKYAKARDRGYIDPNDDFLIGDSGGFLMNIDFTFTDTHLLNEQARYYKDHGFYVDAPTDSPEELRFRLREEHRRKHGYTAKCKKLKDGTVVDLRITGDHYNFLNYGRMIRLEKVNASGITGEKKMGFPNFMDAQYWWFKIKEFCTNNGFNEIVCKTRRGGFSYSEAIDTANEINLNPDFTVILAAEDKKYLTQGNAIAAMAYEQILFYENSTPFARGIIKRNLEDLKLGFKAPNGDDAGYKSKMICVSTFNNADAAIGKDGSKVKCEELGKFGNFDDFATQTMPTLRTGAFVTGKLTAFGTINADNTSGEVFSSNFYNPAKWYFMPFENVWDKNSRHTICGYYKPYWWGLEGMIDGRMAMDENGNTNYELAVRILEAEQKDKWETASTLTDYAKYIGQYGNRPEDSFGASFSNIFTSDELIAHINNVKHNPSLAYFRDGKYDLIRDHTNRAVAVKFFTNEQLYASNRSEDVHMYITRSKPDSKLDNFGCVREYHAPLLVDGKVPDDLYRIWVDPYGVDKDENKQITDDNSFGVAGVYMKMTNINGERGDRLVALFVGRPPKQTTFSEIVLALSIRYNAKVFTENDRGQVVQDFRMWKETRRLVEEPDLAWNTTLAGANGRDYGISMGQGSARKLHGIGYLKEWLYTTRGKFVDGSTIYNFHTITDVGVLDEFGNFNANGNFDRISMMIVGAYDVKELTYKLKNFIDGAKARPKDNKSIFKRNWFTSN